MRTDPMSQALFDEKQTAAILKRASELQGGSSTPREVGLTLGELREVAREAGIDPRWIDQAVADLSGGGPSAPRDTIWGGPLKVSEHRFLPGPVDEETWEDMVAAVRRSFGEVGTVQSWGRSMEWTTGGKGTMQANVTVTKRAEGTSLSVYWNEGILLAPFVVIPLLGSLISIGAVFGGSGLPPLQALALYVSIVAALWLTSRFALSRISRKKRREVRRLVAELEMIAENADPVQAGRDGEWVVGKEERALIDAAAEGEEPLSAPPLRQFDNPEAAPSNRGRVRSR